MEFTSLTVLAQTEMNFLGAVTDFLEFATTHWRFCLLHFLEFAVWGAWFVVLGNMLNARGFSRTEIGRIYSTMPIGSMIAAFHYSPHMSLLLVHLAASSCLLECGFIRTFLRSSMGFQNIQENWMNLWRNGKEKPFLA